nr:hypothetical protein [Tanacetum cinerariifolium]
MASEQNPRKSEKGTTTGIYSEKIEKRESRKVWFLYAEDFRRMQEHVEQQDEGSHVSQHQSESINKQ